MKKLKIKVGFKFNYLLLLKWWDKSEICKLYPRVYNRLPFIIIAITMNIFEQ